MTLADGRSHALNRVAVHAHQAKRLLRPAVISKISHLKMVQQSPLPPCGMKQPGTVQTVNTLTAHRVHRVRLALINQTMAAMLLPIVMW